MARIDIQDISNAERIFVASSVWIAKQVEGSLTQAGVEYAVEVEEIGRTPLFRSLRMGAVFFVAASKAARCRQHLRAGGFASGVVDEVQE